MLNYRFRRLALLFALVSCLLPISSAWASSSAVTLAAGSAANAVFPQTSIGQTASAQVLQLDLNSALALSSITVPASTGGAPEFAVDSISGCAVDGATLNAANSVCSVSISFSPHYPGLRQQPLVVTDSTGATYAFGLTGIGAGPQAVILPGNVTTVSGAAGTTSSTPLGDGGAAGTAALYGPEGLFVDDSSNIYIADTSHNRIRVIYAAGGSLACLIEVENPTLFGLSAGATSCAGASSTPVAGNIYTIAGTGAAGYNQDGIVATSSEINAPGAVTVDAAGNVYIGDVANYRVRVIYGGGPQAACLIEMENGSSFGLGASPTSCSGATSAPTVGYIYTIAGTGTNGYSGDGALAAAAKIGEPYGVALDSAGDLFLAVDSSTSSIGSHIRVVYQGGANAANLIRLENSSVTTPVVGDMYTIMGGSSSTASTGDGALASSGGMLFAYGLYVDLNGNIYFPDKTSGTTPTVAKMRVVYNSGSTLANLIGLENNGVTATPGYVYSIAGTSTVGSGPDGVLATASSLSGTYDAVVDPAGNVYLAERLNETIRKIDASTGLISTIAGVAKSQGVVSGQANTTARLWGPWGVALDSLGGIYFTDNGANRLRNDSAAAGTVTFASTNVAAGSEAQAIIENNIGTGTLQLSSLSASSNFEITPPANVAGMNDCTVSTALSPGQSCALAISFFPTTGGTLTGTASITDNALNVDNDVQVAPLTGTAAGTVTTLTTNPSAITAGDPTTLIATLTSNGNPVTTGTVTFSIPGVTLGSAAVDATSGTASITTSALPAGTVTVTTNYPANGSYTESIASFTLTAAAKPATSTTLNVSTQAANLGQTVTLSSTTTSPVPGTLTGTVSFYDGDTLLGTSALQANGTASLNISTLAAGNHSIVAEYSGDLVYAPSNSLAIPIQVTAPAYSVTPLNPPGIAISSGQTGSLVLTVSTVGGYAQTLTPTCGTLPAGVSCAFSPATLPFTGNNSSQTLTVTVNTVTQRAANTDRQRQPGAALYAAAFGLPGALICLLGVRRKRAWTLWQSRIMLFLVLLSGLAALGGLTACGGNNVVAGARGTFNVPITLTDGSTSTTIDLTVTITGAN